MILKFSFNDICKTSNVWAMMITGKYICLDHMPLGKPGDCVVYSFGINFDFSFNKAMSILGCKVHSFDPFMLLKYPPSARGYIKMKAVPPMVQFHSIGLVHIKTTQLAYA